MQSSGAAFSAGVVVEEGGRLVAGTAGLPLRAPLHQREAA